MWAIPTGIICVNKDKHVSKTAGLGQKHGKFPASETKEYVHGKKKKTFYSYK